MAPTTSPASLLRQLDGEVRQAYLAANESIVRVHIPLSALRPAVQDVVRKWEPRLNADVKAHLSQNDVEATPTTVPATSPVSEVMTVGLVLDDKGALLVPTFLEAERLSRPLRVITREGEAVEATFVASDRRTALTVVRMARPVGKPLRLAAERPAEGELFVLMCGDDSRLGVWTGASRDSGVIVRLDGSISLLRQGRYLGGPGYATLVAALSNNEPVRRATLGMLVNELLPAEQARLGKYNTADRPGLIVSKVLDGSPAQSAGVLPGDLLLEIDGHAIPDTTAIAAALVDVKHVAKVTVGRDGRRMDLTLDVAEPEPTTRGAGQDTGDE